jgi:tetracycline repressor-like protein
VGAAAEVGTRRGRVHDAIASQQREWVDLLERLARAAQRAGELPTDIDPAQLAFELEAMLVTANILCILHGDESALRRAQDAINQRLGAPGPATPACSRD